MRDRGIWKDQVKTIYRDKHTNRLITRHEAENRDLATFVAERFESQDQTSADDALEEGNEERLIQTTVA
jgi:hypothetical protein